MATTFLLSPARMDGRRAKGLLGPNGNYELAARLRAGGTATVGEVFAFLSGLYFRGKLAYATRFAPPERVLVITANQGLVRADAPFTREELASLSDVAIDAADPRYRRPLEIDLAGLAAAAGPDDRFVLLGSIATGKYVEVLRAALDGRLHFPIPFVGRGDMSRGALLLRQAALGEELPYAPIAELAARAKEGKRVKAAAP